MKWMKTIGKWILLLLVGLSVSVFSMFIQVGTDDSERETIGIQKKWGFPVAYRTTAPGLAWADYSGIRFGANTVAWIIGLAAVLAASSRMRRGSNKASHATSEPAPGAASAAPEG
jgi:hypothetical protein